MVEGEAEQFDVVVVGGGVAGLSAALVLARARRRVAVVNVRQPRNAPAAAAQGFLTRDGESPLELVRLGREEVESYGAVFFDGEARTARDDAGIWTLGLGDGNTLRVRHLVLATGLRDVLPDVEGAREAWGKGLLQCPYCHGWEVRDRELGVLATEETSLQQAVLLRQWSSAVTLFTHTLGTIPSDDALTLEARGVRIVDGAVRRLVSGPAGLESVELADGTVVECAAVFCEPQAEVDSPLISALGCDFREDGCVATDDLGRTSIDRVWAVGNVADPGAQLISAAGDAYRTAVSVNAILAFEDAESEKASR
ncbi:NAD(P)/FAD-dependent oxidoreductase [Arthrobacter sp. H41]|uniref:NAD(P)/FAD-dependent oxidoreductase n=1 Tax=Arthrobacter sp. H41 TaxID=1312978 RepID=UPI0004797E7D|nr:NAD(P)/FAD-dependent oxidoreductase [Arthrobacter sp. H41]